MAQNKENTIRMPSIEELQKIYYTLQDHTSRDIYACRLLYALLERKEAIKTLASDYNPDAALWRSKNKKICFYGAGTGVNWLIRYGTSICFVVDKYKTGEIEGLPVISLDTFLQFPDCREYLLILTQGDALLPEVEAELDALGLQHISLYHDVLPGHFHRQYFDLPQLNLGKQEEYFVDVGAFDGYTSNNFLQRCEQGRAYVFEPNPEQLDTVKGALQAYGDRVELFPYALYDENVTLSFDIRESADCSRISEAGTTKIQARRMDDVLAGRKVTFVKMDIEGAELSALRGAEQIIREQRPKLGIAIYHRPEDMWEIPSLLLQYNPSYRFYLRHYTMSYYDTVLYAI